MGFQLSRFARGAFAAFVAVTLPFCSSDDGESEGDEAGGSGGSEGAVVAPDAGGGGSTSASAGSAGTTTTGGAGGAPAPPATVELQPEWVACTQDSDCEVIQVRAICACWTPSVNTAFRADVEAEFARGDTPRVCPPSVCPPLAATSPICVEGTCDIAVDCEQMGQSLLCGELNKCSNLVATPCGGTEREQIGCFPRQVDARIGDTCGVDPDTGERMTFLTEAIPPGWSLCPGGSCDGQAVIDAGTDSPEAGP